MEVVVFLVVGVGLLFYLARGRFGRGADGRGAGDGGPPTYGNTIRPPGTSAAMDVNAGWFRRPHDGDGAGNHRSSGAE